MLIQAFQKVRFADLSDRLKRNFNYQKVSAVLADYGFATFWISEDGADFLAIHKDGGVRSVRKVLIKEWITIADECRGKDIWIAAPHARGWFIYPHDAMLELIEAVEPFKCAASWQTDKLHSWQSPSNALLDTLAPYFVEGDTSAGR